MGLRGAGEAAEEVTRLILKLTVWVRGTNPSIFGFGVRLKVKMRVRSEGQNPISLRGAREAIEKVKRLILKLKV
jgi:hypothetical protein